jgi:hypothetical protein
LGSYVPANGKSQIAISLLGCDEVHERNRATCSRTLRESFDNPILYDASLGVVRALAEVRLLQSGP